jgi:hypothetical protein
MFYNVLRRDKNYNTRLYIFYSKLFPAPCRPLMITSHQAENQQLPDNKIQPNLRYGVIRFLKAFCEEGIDEILKMEGKLIRGALLYILSL